MKILKKEFKEIDRWITSNERKILNFLSELVAINTENLPPKIYKNLLVDHRSIKHE